MAEALIPSPASSLGAWRMAPAFVLGLVLATGHAPLGWTPAALVALALVFLLEGRCEGPGAAALAGWAVGLGYFGGSMFWIVEPFLVDPVRHGWMAPFALLLLPGGLALFWAAAFALTAQFGRDWRRPFLLAALLAGAEVLRANVFTGFPWSMIGYIWVGTTQMQAAAWLGPFGLTFVTLLAAAACTVWVGRQGNWLLVPAFGFLGLAVADIAGAARLRAADPAPTLPVTVRVIQPNAEQNLKWNAELASQWVERLLSRTAAPHIGRGPDVIVWPETALPYTLNGAGDVLGEIDAAARGRPVMFGAVRREERRVFNSLVVTAAGGFVSQIYDKHHLTPFGEYMPLGDLFARVGVHGLAASEGAAFTAGRGPEVLSVAGAGLVLPLICYEAIFPGNLRTETRPDWILHITNDAWFGRIAGPYQHLAQARMRAVEQGLPVVRAANTGISAVIDPKGRIVAALPLGVEGHFDETIPVALPPTFYARTGDWPVFVAIALLAGLLMPGGGRKSD